MGRDISSGLTYSKPTNSDWSIRPIIPLKVLKEQLIIVQIDHKGNKQEKKKGNLLAIWRKLDRFIRKIRREMIKLLVGDVSN